LEPISSYIKSLNGYQLHRVCWQTNQPPRAQVVLVHGFGEHVLRYSPYFSAFTKAGIRCSGADLYGHGKSDGKRGDLKQYQQFLVDTDQWLKLAYDEYPNIPVFLYGHSMGGNIVLRYLEYYNPEFVAGAIIGSPWLKLTKDPNVITQALVSFFAGILPHFAIPSGLDTKYLSRIQGQVNMYNTDPLVHGKISFKLLNQIMQNGKLAIERAYKINQKVLLMHGLADNITSSSASAQLSSGNSRFITYKPFKGAYHELHNDACQHQVANEVLQWINQILANR
jgi:acylglycerol lipase